jgi:hypothetical protein
MGKIPYTIFLAIASVKEIAQIFSLRSNGLVELAYLIFFVYIIVKMFSDSLPPFVWSGAFAIIGLSALVYLLLTAFGVPNQPIKIIDSIVCLGVWFKSLIYLNNYKDEDFREI